MQTKILIVEDNPLNFELAADLLEAAGYKVIRAEVGEEGVQLAQQHLPDLILMDVSLPGMDGLQATRTLKENPSTREIPIIALTAHAMKGDEAKALAAGCAGYLTKPINTRTFSETITSFVSEKSSKQGRAIEYQLPQKS